MTSQYSASSDAEDVLSSLTVTSTSSVRSSVLSRRGATILENCEEMDLNQFRNHFERNNKMKEYEGHNAVILTLDWNHDGQKLASGSADSTASVFQMGKDKLLKVSTLMGHRGSINHLCWNATHTDLVATVSSDKTVRVWDARMQNTAHIFSTKDAGVNVAWSRDGSCIAVGNESVHGMVTFLDFKATKVRKEVAFKFQVNEFTFNPDSNVFLLTNEMGHVLVYTFPEMKLVHQVKAHTSHCLCIEFDPTGRNFAVGSCDAILSVGNAAELAAFRTFSNFDHAVRALSFNHDGTVVASGSEDRFIDISHVESGEQVCQIPLESGTFSLAFHPKCNILALCCEDRDRFVGGKDRGTLKLFGFPS